MGVSSIMENNFWKNKIVLVTGHTGFKGSWLCIWLNKKGAKVVGYSLNPYTKKDNFVLSSIKDKIIEIRGDIRDVKKLNEVFDIYNPEIVFHLAAQPLVLESYNAPVYTYEINVMGTVNMLECIKQSNSCKTAIFITTDKCYENKEQVWSYKENDALGGLDPYSSSKAACEIAINSWRNSYLNPIEYKLHGKCIASVRSGNVIGGGDWSKNRIIPDCIRAFEANEKVKIRNPYSIRPWQHVFEALNGYLMLAEVIHTNPTKFCSAWNFGPTIESVVNVEEVVNKVIKYYGSGNIDIDVLGNYNHEANLLNLDISKSFFELKWRPKLNIEETISLTVDWYKNYKFTHDMYEFCVNQIEFYENL